jgi:hypothetical protein
VAAFDFVDFVATLIQPILQMAGRVGIGVLRRDVVQIDARPGAFLVPLHPTFDRVFHVRYLPVPYIPFLRAGYHPVRSKGTIVQVSKTKTILLCALPGLASVLPMLLKGSPVLNNDMLVAYFCYFWDFHKNWSFAHPLPLWGSSYQCGMPMYAYWQSGYLYPITWILFGPLSPHVGIHLFYAFHFALGIFGFLKLGPFLRLKPFAAYWGGLCFALSGTMLARYEHATFLAGWAWLPAVLAAFLALRASPGPKTLALYAGSVTMQAMGGHPQASAAAAILIGIFTVGTLVRAGLARDIPRRSLAWILGGHALALVWCLPLLVPFLDLVNRTDRYDGTAWEGVASPPTGWQSGDFDFEKFSTGAMRPLHLVSLAAAHALGTPSNGSWWGGESWGEVFVYIGCLGVFFCFFASPRRAGPQMRWLWAAGIVGLWMAFGPHLGASQIQYHIPFFNGFRRPARFLILFTLGLSALSAHGFQRWAAGPKGRMAPALGAAAGLAALAFACLRYEPSASELLARWLALIRHFDPAETHYIRKLALLGGRYTMDAIAFSFSAGAVWLVTRRGRKALPALYLVLILDLLRLHWDHFYLFPAAYYRTPPASVRWLDEGTRPFWRVNHYLEYPGLEMWQMHNDPVAHFDLLEREKTALSYGIHAVFGYRHVSAHLPLLWRWDPSLTPGGKSGRYLFSNRELEVFHGDSLQQMGRTGEVFAYEVKGWLPRLETQRAYSASAPGASVLPAFPTFPTPSTLAPATSAAFPPCDPGFSGYGDLCAYEPRDGELIVTGRWRAGDTLRFRERFDAGWRYRVEGGEWRPAQAAAGGFMDLGLDRDAGGMEIEYHPAGFFRLAGFSYGLAGIGLFGLLLLGGRGGRFRLRRFGGR